MYTLYTGWVADPGTFCVCTVLHAEWIAYSFGAVRRRAIRIGGQICSSALSPDAGHYVYKMFRGPRGLGHPVYRHKHTNEND